MKFYKKTWFILLLLLFFAPAGIGLMWWQKRSWHIVPKVLATGLACVVFLSAVISPPSSGAVIKSTHEILLSTTSATTLETAMVETTTKPTTFALTTTESKKPAATIKSTTQQTTIATTKAATTSSELKVHFLDVSQGASTLFEIGDKTLLIDGGDRDKSQFVVAYLKKQGIKQVDVMIATHYDADHLNGLVGVLNVFSVKQVFDANYATDTRVFNSFKTYIKDHNIPEAVPGMRQSIQVGEAAVTFIAPRLYGHSTANDDSICVRVQFGETSFVIMGDPSADAEQQILGQNLDSDVFYASHHGSNGSNSKTLLTNVSPAFVVISCGADNSYGHPGDNTLAVSRTPVHYSFEPTSKAQSSALQTVH